MNIYWAGLYEDRSVSDTGTYFVLQYNMLTKNVAKDKVVKWVA